MPQVGPWVPDTFGLNRESKSKRERKLENKRASPPPVRVGRSRVRQAWVRIPALLLVCCVTLGMWFTSEPRFPHL